MATNTLNSEFDSLGNPWQPIYPWATQGFTGGDMGSWLGNPSLLPSDANPLSVGNGVLTISDFSRPSDVDPGSVGNMPRIGGMIDTQGQFSQTYGYFEARIQMPATTGTGGAFWMMPESGASKPELDVAEMIGQNPTVLVNTVWGPDINNHWTDVANMTQGFHTYAVDWEPDTTTWYFDGQQTFQTPTPPDLNQPMYLIASLNSGQPGSWEGEADPSATAHMKIAYIRAYDANPYTSGGKLTASLDNSNSGSNAVTGAGSSTSDSSGSTGSNSSDSSTSNSSGSASSDVSGTGGNSGAASPDSSGTGNSVATMNQGNNGSEGIVTSTQPNSLTSGDPASSVSQTPPGNAIPVDNSGPRSGASSTKPGDGNSGTNSGTTSPTDSSSANTAPITPHTLSSNASDQITFAATNDPSQPSNTAQNNGASSTPAMPDAQMTSQDLGSTPPQPDASAGNAAAAPDQTATSSPGVFLTNNDQGGATFGGSSHHHWGA